MPTEAKMRHTDEEETITGFEENCSQAQSTTVAPGSENTDLQLGLEGY